jgi:hypothetical protein
MRLCFVTFGCLFAFALGLNASTIGISVKGMCEGGSCPGFQARCAVCELRSIFWQHHGRFQESRRQCGLRDQPLEVVRRCKINSFGEFFDLDRDG